MAFNYSIIVPYRDKYDLLVTAISSVPDREDIQIIIADNSLQSLPVDKIPSKEMAHVDYIISPPAKGAGGARNEGLKHAQGKYLLFLDADDYFTNNALSSFDEYLNSDYDIVFFKPTSIKLSDGTKSCRHTPYVKQIDDYFSNGNEDKLRFWYTVPWSKMIRAELVKEHAIKFDETFASNDLMFSVKTGYFASKIYASSDTVYVVTEAGSNESIDKTKTKEAQYARFTVAVSQYEFMEKVGRKDQRFSLLSFVLRSWKDFGFSEFLRYIRYCMAHKVNIFANIL